MTNSEPVRPSRTIAPIGQNDLVGLKEKLEEQRNKVRDAEIEIEEADVPRVPAKVYTPTPEEYNKHCATHLPYRNWCPICVQAKKRNPAHKHKSTNESKNYIPVISMDYMYMNETMDESNNPILVVHDSVSEGVWAIFARRKGDSAYVTQKVVHIISRLGYSKIIIKSDQEPAIKAVECKIKENIFEDMKKLQSDIKETCGCQVVVQHSPVGESAANGAIENAIQRVQGQIRAIKLDLETNIKAKLNPSQSVWPWLIEYAAQTLLYWRVTGEDGLTAIQRIRGRSTTAPRPRFGERVMYKIPKVVKIGKSEARWRYGVWIGSMENSDEHLIGTPLGVVKARAVTALPEEQRFNASAIDELQGTPWRPSTKHKGTKIRTHIGDDDEQDDENEDEFEDIQMEIYDEEDPDDSVEQIAKKQNVIFSRVGQSYSFTIKARDVLKYDPHPGCPGCKFVMGEVTTQTGHSKECKARIMAEMEKDKVDKHRVRKWFVAKGVDEEKISFKESEIEEQEIQGGGAVGPGDVQMSSASSSSGLARGAAESNADKRDRGDHDEQAAKRHKNGEALVAEKESKKAKLNCLNICDYRFMSADERNKVVRKYFQEKPLFVVTSLHQPVDVRKMLHEEQHRNMRYFIDVMGNEIVTNSAAVMSLLKAEGIVDAVIEQGHFPRGVIAQRTAAKAVEDAVNQGMEMQMGVDARQLFVCEVIGQNVQKEDIDEIHESANKCHESENHDEIAWDDVNNCQLDPARVRAARMAEMEYFRKMRVYRKVPIQKCKDVTGKPPIKVRWVDTNKQDESNPKYRSRLVAKDFKRYNDPELYAATPPIEMLRYIVSRAATGWSRTGRRRKIMVNDVARAYFNAPNLTPVFVELCDEDKQPGDEGMCGELLVSMYGTRPAASNWQKCYTDLLCGHGFRMTRANTCMFWHPDRDIALMVHGDDFITVADEMDLQWLRDIFASKFEITTEIIGPEENDKKQLKVLNRFVSVTESGYTYEPDTRHAEVLVRELGLEAAKTLSTPAADKRYESEELLDHERFKKYQSLCARANFLAIDRIDIQYAAKECCRAMSRPTMRDWAKLKRLGRYIAGSPRLVYEYPFQEEQNLITVYSDANWASDASDRRSTSGGVIQHGSHYLKSWSKTQSLVALSSAESELYGLVKASSEALGFQSTIRDMGQAWGTVVLSDASAALGVIQRQGLGRLRHVDCGFLFVQGLNARKIVQFSKVPGSDNPADVCTKGVGGDALVKHTLAVGGSYRTGRPQLCPDALKSLLRTKPTAAGSEGGCETLGAVGVPRY